MLIMIKQIVFLSGLVSSLFTWSIILPALDQVTFDGTTNTIVSPNGSNFDILDDIQKGNNLFHNLFRDSEAYLLAGDEVVITKAGKETYGLDKFFSSLLNKPISGLSFFALSLVSVEQRRSFPISIEQRKKSDVEKTNATSSSIIKPKQKRGRGRPKGSKNKNKAEVVLTSELLLIKKMINELFKLIANLIPITYVVLDGHFGNNNALQMARQVNLHIISKLRHDSASYIPYKNPDPNGRSRSKYGDRFG